MGLFSKASKSNGWMAVCLYPERVDLAHVVRRLDGRPEVKLLDSCRREKSAADTLAALRRQYRLGSFRCITALLDGEYRMLQVDAPEVPAAELREAMRWRIKDMIDFAPDAATLDLATVPAARPGASSSSLFVFAAKNEVVRSRMEAFDKAKVPLAAIDVPEMALRNVAALWAEPGRAAALLSFDDGGGLLVIAAGGELYSARRIEVAAAQLANAAEAQQNYERVGLEIQRSFDHYDRQFGSLPLARLVVAAPQAEGLVGYLAGNLYVPVEAADLSAVMDFPSVPEMRDAHRQAHCLLAIGLALRNGGGAP